jgi:DNA-binding CsgD family transcriptional regulator
VSCASVSFAADPIMAADVARLARAVRPRLDRCAPEHEAVVRQMPVLVRDTQTATGLFRPLTHVARTAAYVVAPIVRDGHTVGLLHADHFGAGRELDELDRELLWTITTRLGATGREGELSGHPGRLATLTARELEVLHLMSEGASNAAIGGALVISQATVKSHVRHILRKLGAVNRTEAVSFFLATGRRPSAASA